jgi:hypothetical protein
MGTAHLASGAPFAMSVVSITCVLLDLIYLFCRPSWQTYESVFSSFEPRSFLDSSLSFVPSVESTA